MILYANDEKRGAFPRTLYADQAPRQPDPLDPAAPLLAGTPYEDGELGPRDGVEPFPVKGLPPDLAPYIPAPNDVTAPMYLLLRTQDLTPGVFVCPSTRRPPFDPGVNHDVDDYTNFPGHAALREHLSYSSQNPYATSAAIGRGFKYNYTLGSDFALMSDINPGGEAVIAATADADAGLLRRANSPNHYGDGQNVLYADGNVDFADTPFVGVRDDNISTARAEAAVNEPRNNAGAVVMASPLDKFDSVLLPTAELIGQEPVAPPTIEEVERAAQLQAGETFEAIMQDPARSSQNLAAMAYNWKEEAAELQAIAGAARRAGRGTIADRFDAAAAEYENAAAALEALSSAFEDAR